MAENSKIEWTDHTFNPWMGCTKVAPECAHCYAEELMDSRYGKAKWGPNGTRVITSVANWKLPAKWNREAEAEGVRKRVFCASLADVFEDWQGELFGNTGCLTTLDEVRQNLFHLIDATPYLDWLLLTKRPENILNMWQAVNGSHYRPKAYRPNVWLGTSAGTQATADKAIPELLKCRELAPVLFVSAEPLLGPVDLLKVPNPDAYFQHTGRTGVVSDPKEPDDYVYWASKAIDWLICGGESGHGARPMRPDWARSLRDQCNAARVPFLFKQWGEYAPVTAAINDTADWDGTAMKLVGKKTAGRILDGRTWDEYPVVEHVTK